MDLTTSLTEYVQAAFSGLYIRTLEPQEALREIAQQAHTQKWRLATWDIDRGLQVGDTTVAAGDPLAAIRSLPSLATTERATSLLVLRNFHRFLGSAEVIQALEHQLALGKTSRTFVVILAPVVQLPLGSFLASRNCRPSEAAMGRNSRRVLAVSAFCFW